jgi:DNA-binding MarR family transcriptional regulator
VDADDGPALAPELPLWELVRTYHPAARRFGEVFAAAGLGPTQFGVLVSLAETDVDPDPGPSQADLARQVLVRPQSMGELVTGLLDRGLVSREGAGGRGRRARLRITAAGRDALAGAVPGVNAVNDPAALGLDPDEVTMLVGLLRRVRARLEEPAP